MTEKECANLFNQGYILQRENPHLLDLLMSAIDKEKDTYKLLQAGKEQYKLEQRLEKIKQKQRKQSKGRSL